MGGGFRMKGGGWWGGDERRVSPGEQIDELGFGHAVGQDAGDGSHAGPEQIDLGLPLPAVSGRKMKMDARELRERWLAEGM